MNSSEQNHLHRYFQLPLIPINPEDRLSQIQKATVSMQGPLIKFLSHMDLGRQAVSESLNMKSNRFDKLNFLKKQSKKFRSLKCSIKKNVESFTKEDEYKTKINNNVDLSNRDTFLRESIQKNSLMNKILSLQKKANQFILEKNPIFENLSKHPLHRQQLKSVQPCFKDPLNVSSDKMVALLSDRPFQRKYSFGVPFGKLKMNKNIKQLQKRYIQMNQSILSSQNHAKVNLREQNYQMPSLNNIPSLHSLQKTTIKTDTFKQPIKALGKIRRASKLQKYPRPSKKNSLLTISDDQSQIKSSENISIQKYSQNRILTQPSKKSIKAHLPKETKLKKCQDRILSDLAKLERQRQQQSIYSQRQSQLKNSKSHSISYKQAKLSIKDRSRQGQNNSQRSKYIIKFKTQPKQTPLKKLKLKISAELYDDYQYRGQFFQGQALQINQIYGLAQTLNKKNPVDVAHPKGLKQKRMKAYTNRSKETLAEKELSGWEDTKDNWNLNLF